MQTDGGVKAPSVPGEGGWAVIGSSNPVADEASVAPLHALLEGFGLSGYEARVLLALLRAGLASASQLARLSGVARQNVYTVLHSLSSRRLAEAVPGDTGRWASPGRSEVLRRLYATEEARLRDLQSRMAEAEKLLDQLGPETPSAALPYIHVIPTSAMSTVSYTELVGSATSELLVFNKGPYDGSFGTPKPAVLDALARGVAARALYQKAELADPGLEPFWRENEAYHAAGAEGRVVEGLPLRLVVVDRRVALLALPDPVLPSGGFPANVLVEHPGFATAMAGTFEHYWVNGQPYADARAGGFSPGEAGRR